MKEQEFFDESDLINRAKNGDQEALSSLYSHFLTPVYRYVYLRVRHKQSAEDITQTVFLKAFKAFSGYDQKRSPTMLAFLFTIARNTIIDGSRSQKPGPEELNEEVLPPESISQIGPELELVQKQESQMLYKALSQLPQEHQDAVIMKYIDGLRHQDIANILNKTEEATRQLIFRASRQLRDILNSQNV